MFQPWDPSTGASQVSATERAAQTLNLELIAFTEDLIGSGLSRLNGAAEWQHDRHQPLGSRA